MRVLDELACPVKEVPVDISHTETGRYTLTSVLAGRRRFARQPSQFKLGLKK